MSVWDKLAVSTPRDRTAAVVTGQSSALAPIGPLPAEGHVRWDVPPPLTRVASDQPDLTGRVCGFLKVVGYLGRLPKRGRGRWLVRCRCGYFEARSANAITNPVNGADACRECRHHEHLKQREREKPVRPVEWAPRP